MTFNGWAVGLNGIILTGSPEGTQEALDADCPEHEGLVIGCALEAPPDGLGLPSLRTEDVTYAQRDGVEHFSDWYGPRIITLPVVTVCPGCGCGPGDDGGMTAREGVRRILTAWDRHCGDTELVIWTDCNSAGADEESFGYGEGPYGETPYGGSGGADRVTNGPFGVIGRPRIATVDWHGPSKCATMLLRFDGVDHRMYVLDECGTPGSGVECVTLQPDTSTAARCYDPDQCYPKCYTTPLGDAPPSAVAAVLGDVCPEVTVTLTGPLSGPIIVENETTGQALLYTGSIGASDQPVVIDVADRTATQGESTRTHLLSGSFSLVLGANVLKLRSSNPDDSGTASVCWRVTVLSA